MDGDEEESSRQSAGSSEWLGISLQELLDADSRPSFVVDLQGHPHPPHVSITYRNSVFSTQYDFEDIVWRDVQHERSAFKAWALSSQLEPPQHVFCGLIWTAAIVRHRWKVVHGTSRDIHSPGSPPNVSRASKRKAEEPAADHINTKVARFGNHDWTRSDLVPDPIGSHTKFLRSWDWASTPLGSIDSWPPILKSMANLVNTDPNPAVLFWGPKMAHVYNEAYIAVLNKKHPSALGQPYLQTWAELYANPQTAELLDHLWIEGRANGKATLMPHQTFFLHNAESRPEERVFNLSVLPIIGESGETVGFYEPFTEITSDFIGERRSATVRRVGEVTAGEENTANFFRKIASALEENGTIKKLCITWRAFAF
jgi:hypothetical protein